MSHNLLRPAVLLSIAVLSACALRLGGPSPVELDVAALAEPRNADAAAVAQKITAAGAEIVLLAGERTDTAWYTAVAATARLELSGPGTTTGRGYAFMTNLEILGDTTLVLNVPGGGNVHMHDALYSIDDSRNIDLMLVQLRATDLRAAVRTLLDYIATDVPADAPLLLVFDDPTPARADSAAVMVRATIANASDCRDDAAAPQPAVRLMYGPSARVRCISARDIPDAQPGIVARLEVGRW
ncbi:MAG TPA: hypothetical protein VFZ24_16735 [Longimicrobiales bacterium]